jgi:hypothetical protein
VLRLGRNAAVLFVRDAPHPILATRLRYFEESMFAGLWDRWRERVAPPLLLEAKPLRCRCD